MNYFICAFLCFAFGNSLTSALKWDGKNLKSFRSLTNRSRAKYLIYLFTNAKEKTLALFISYFLELFLESTAFFFSELKDKLINFLLKSFIF